MSVDAGGRRVKRVAEAKTTGNASAAAPRVTLVSVLRDVLERAGVAMSAPELVAAAAGRGLDVSVSMVRSAAGALVDHNRAVRATRRDNGRAVVVWHAGSERAEG